MVKVWDISGFINKWYEWYEQYEQYEQFYKIYKWD